MVRHPSGAPVTIHAIDTGGNHKVVAVNGNPKNTYWLWRSGDPAPQSLPAEIVTLAPISAKPDPAVTYGSGKG